MRAKKIILLAGLTCAALLTAVLLTPNGFWEMRELQSQMARTQVHIRQIEDSNQELRRKVELFRKEDQSAANFRWREELGLIRKGELLYIESMSANGPSHKE
jgi:cell division protein FtsB